MQNSCMAKTSARPATDDMEIAPGYTVADWSRLDLQSAQSPDWTKAIEIFDARIRRRFIDPADVLIAHEIGLERGTFGFAILAIDCLVVETLQGFREGCIKHHGKALSGSRSRSEELFVNFLHQRFQQHFTEAQGTALYKRCRCAIHHSGQTEGDLRVSRSGLLVEFLDNSRMVVNRTAFHNAVKGEFESYMQALRDGVDVQLRTNFRNKMNSVCGI